ncbi:MAG: CopG family transcriptional regulator [Chloroflexota bacterium]
MKKTSVYLTDEDVTRLRRLAASEDKSQAEVIREALRVYEAHEQPDRRFSLTAAWDGDGTSVVGVPEHELLEGFGS